MEILEKLRKRAADLPLKPGVYIMLGEDGNVIYVGKAKKLKNRVSSYFHGSHNSKTEAMISNIRDFNFIVANSEFEALVLENSLIKRHMPKYNILLKDDKGYPFIRLDVKSLYPRFTVVSGVKDDGARYFGPYGSRGATFSAIEAVSTALGLPQCSRAFPRDIGKQRPCLNYHMGICGGYCLKDTPKADYDRAVKEAVMVFEGKTDVLVKELKKAMNEAAESLRFERAAEYRDRIKAIELLGTKQTAWNPKSVDTDAVGFWRGDKKSCFVVLRYVGGQLLSKDRDIIETPVEDDSEAVSALIRQYYSLSGTIPPNIVLHEAVGDMDELERMLSETSGKRVHITVPERGEKKKLADTALLNAKEEIMLLAAKGERTTKAAEWLKSALKLPKAPVRIEAFDISNTGNTDIVAAMTVFENGKPKKNDYRRFKINSARQDDYGSMVEAVSRRFKEYAAGNEKFSELPDLLLIDGGEEHAAVAKSVTDSMSLSIPVYGMVKDGRHRTRGLISPEGDEIGLAAYPYVFSFIGRIQEETHRFAIEYNRKLHGKSAVGSELDKIDGVGEKRRAALLKAFGSVKNIKTKSVEELSRVVPKNTAVAVFRHFNP